MPKSTVSATQHAIRKTGGYTPFNVLARKLGEFSVQDTALVVTGMETFFAAPEKHGYAPMQESTDITKRIISLMPEFNKLGIPTYILGIKDMPRVDGLEGGPGDKVLITDLVDWRDLSRGIDYRGSHALDTLGQDGKKLLLLAGHHTSFGIASTTQSAFNERCRPSGVNFMTCLLGDAISDGAMNESAEWTSMHMHLIRNKMEDGGSPVPRAKDVLKLMRNKNGG